jgi:putative ABC transport system permease protein
MIRNYIKTAFRIMMRQKGYSVINLAGLSIGIATSLLIILYITDELSFDRFHKDANRIYRMGYSGRLQGTEFASATTPVPLAEGLQAEVPGVESTVRFAIWRNTPISLGEKNFTERNFLVADSNFFEFFSFHLLSGDAGTALVGTNRVVLSASAARRYFGDENPLGKAILMGSEKRALEVVGVATDPPATSHIQFDMVLSADSWDFMRTNKAWTAINLYTYFKALPSTDLNAIRTQVDQLTIRHIGPELETFIGMTFKEFLKGGNNVGLFIQPLLDIHLKSDLQEELTPNSDVQYLYVFGVIALFMLVIACINFMNLTTARSANRAKEVGVRKSVGAFRGKLVGQFISESMLYSIIATFVAIALVSALLPSFNLLSGKSIVLSSLVSPALAAGIVMLTLLIGILAGSYPAFYLTAFRPADVLKGKLRSGARNSALRNGLVVFQFVISIGMIVSSLVVYKQLRYMQEKDMGFDRENVIRLMHTWSLGSHAKVFKDELMSHPEFASASFASELPPFISNFRAFRKSGSDQDYIMQAHEVDVDNLEALKYTLTQGRFFSRAFKSDTATVVINQAAFQQMGLASIENQTIYDYTKTPVRPMKIIGVIKDFNYASLRQEVKPLVFLPSLEHNGVLAVRLTAGNAQEKVKLLEKIWTKYSTDPFEFTFIDQDFDGLFRAEQRLGTVILLFTGLTIFIACLGLFGLATYASQQRAKEISIRKVMGASVSQVIQLLFRDLSVLVGIAFVIAVPLGIYLMHQWLQGFAYRVSIDVWAVLLAGLASFFIAFLSVGFQSVKAATENPVRALKSE